jgi:hypothetical protein
MQDSKFSRKPRRSLLGSITIAQVTSSSCALRAHLRKPGHGERQRRSLAAGGKGRRRERDRRGADIEDRQHDVAAGTVHVVRRVLRVRHIVCQKVGQAVVVGAWLGGGGDTAQIKGPA